MGTFDRIFVNDFGLPFNSGVLFFFLLIIGLIVFGLFKTRESGNSTWNTAILGVLVLLIGYSSYSTVILRSSINTPINIGLPDDPLKLSSYLQRDQYGDWPIVSGQQYNQKYPIVNPIGQETIGTEYLKNKEKGIYEDMGNKIKYTYRDKEFFSLECGLIRKHRDTKDGEERMEQTPIVELNLERIFISFLTIR